MANFELNIGLRRTSDLDNLQYTLYRDSTPIDYNSGSVDALIDKTFRDREMFYNSNAIAILENNSATYSTINFKNFDGTVNGYFERTLPGGFIRRIAYGDFNTYNGLTASKIAILDNNLNLINASYSLPIFNSDASIVNHGDFSINNAAFIFSDIHRVNGVTASGNTYFVNSDFSVYSTHSTVPVLGGYVNKRISIGYYLNTSTSVDLYVGDFTNIGGVTASYVAMGIENTTSFTIATQSEVFNPTPSTIYTDVNFDDIVDYGPFIDAVVLEPNKSFILNNGYSLIIKNMETNIVTVIPTDDLIKSIQVVDGLIYICGSFTIVNGQTSNNIAVIEFVDDEIVQLYTMTEFVEIGSTIDRFYVDNDYIMVYGQFTVIGSYDNLINMMMFVLDSTSLVPQISHSGLDIYPNAPVDGLVNVFVKSELDSGNPSYGVIFAMGSFTGYTGDPYIGTSTNNIVPFSRLDQFLDNTTAAVALLDNFETYNNSTYVSYTRDGYIVTVSVGDVNSDLIYASDLSYTSGITIGTDINNTVPNQDTILTRSSWNVSNALGTASTHVNYKITMYGGSYTDIPETVTYEFTKPRVSINQDYTRVDLEGLTQVFIEPSIDLYISAATNNSVNDTSSTDSCWVSIDETIYSGLTSSAIINQKFISLDGWDYTYNGSNPIAPEVLLTGSEFYSLTGGSSKIHFKTPNLESITYSINNGTPQTITVIADTEFNYQYFMSLKVANNVDKVSYTFRYLYESGYRNITKVFYNKQECMFDNSEVIFKNRFGLFQTIPFYAKRVDNIDVTRETYKRSIINYNGSFNPHLHGTNINSVEASKSFKLSTGFMTEDMSNNIMPELFMSDKVFIRTDNRLYPVVIKDTSYTYKTRLNDRVIEYNMTFDYAHNLINKIK